ncbi:glycoside hydrolase family 3 protein [Lentzea sp. NPDC102401]|uniref:glycoside hydrolase family 3 protein n=1 Tax=Lentzea sp. NPDC102401 TaxID=3364128 RepID=UPI00380EFF22
MTSLSTLVNSCLLPAYGGAVPADWLKRDLDDGLAGIVLFGANLDLIDGQIRAVVAEPLRAHQPDVIIALDEEGGDITRAEYHRGSNYPGNFALGAVDEPELTFEVAASIAADLIEAGVSVNLAPSVDVCPGQRMPLMGTRSFGADAARVAAHAAAFVEGVQRHGVAATAKHFPGIGSTSVDSHFQLPTVHDPEPVLRARDLLPFEACVRAGVRAVMTGHVVARAIDRTPATFSRRFITDVLRGELEFDGVVISDALDMTAARGDAGFAVAAVRSLQAGVDLMILGPQDGEETCALIRDGVRRAVEDGGLPLSRLEEAARRVAALKEWSSAPRGPEADLGGVGLSAARRALQIGGPTPVPASWFVVEARGEPNISCGSVPWGLQEVLRRLGGTVGGVQIHERGDIAGVRFPADVPVAVVVRAETADSWQHQVVAAVLRQRADAVVVDMGFCDVPVPPGTSVVKTRGAGLVNAVAAAELLSGHRTTGAPRNWL